MPVSYIYPLFVSCSFLSIVIPHNALAINASKFVHAHVNISMFE